MEKNLNEYKEELADILKRMIAAKENYKHLNSVNIDRHINLMEEAVFRANHQINKIPLATNSLYIESNSNPDHCMNCEFYSKKECKFRKCRVDGMYGYCPEFEEN